MIMQRGDVSVGKFSNVCKVQMVRFKKIEKVEKISNVVLLIFIHVTTKATTTGPG